MKSLGLHLLESLVLLPAVACIPRQTGAPASSTETPAAAGVKVTPIARDLPRPEVIAVSAPLPGFMKGINIGNGYDAPREGAWGVVVSEQHFAMAADAGFDHVRLPVRFSAPDRTSATPPYTIKEEFFKKIDWAIDRALNHKLSVILDIHHYEEIHKEPGAHKERLYAMWRQISERYRSRPPQLAFEILNEPNGALTPALVNEITAEAVRIIREKNPTRIVFADSYFWAAADRLGELELPAADPNLVAQFHMYQPILFTHQGAGWMEPWYQTRGVIFPGPPPSPIVPLPMTQSQPWVTEWFAGYNQLPPEQNPGGPRTIFEHFDHAARWVKQHNQRVYLGEFGAIDVADATSRENYVWLVRTEAERRGIGWCYWDNGSSFKVMDPRNGTWNQGLRRALLDR